MPMRPENADGLFAYGLAFRDSAMEKINTFRHYNGVTAGYGFADEQRRENGAVHVQAGGYVR